MNCCHDRKFLASCCLNTRTKTKRNEISFSFSMLARFSLSPRRLSALITAHFTSIFQCIYARSLSTYILCVYYVWNQFLLLIEIKFVFSFELWVNIVLLIVVIGLSTLWIVVNRFPLLKYFGQSFLFVETTSNVYSSKTKVQIVAKITNISHFHVMRDDTKCMTKYSHVEMGAVMDFLQYSNTPWRFLVARHCH